MLVGYFLGVDQIIFKNGKEIVKKAAECREIKFLFLAIGQSNPPPFSYKVSDGVKPLWDETAFPDLIIFFRC